jgi:hypothetical protein
VTGDYLWLGMARKRKELGKQHFEINEKQNNSRVG